MMWLRGIYVGYWCRVVTFGGGRLLRYALHMHTVGAVGAVGAENHLQEGGGGLCGLAYLLD